MRAPEPCDAPEPQEKESTAAPCEATEEAAENVSHSRPRHLSKYRSLTCCPLRSAICFVTVSPTRPPAPVLAPTCNLSCHCSQQASSASSIAEAHAPETAGHGLMRFLNSYTLPFSPSQRSSAQLSPSSPDTAGARSPLGAVSPSTGSDVLARALRTGTRGGGTYPLSTVVVVALIAFLVGSLLQSLLSPADFIYVVTDEKEVGSVSAGTWREMKRLLEFKYVLGGWDFQIAVVRRH